MIAAFWVSDLPGCLHQPPQPSSFYKCGTRCLCQNLSFLFIFFFWGGQLKMTSKFLDNVIYGFMQNKQTKRRIFTSMLEFQKMLCNKDRNSWFKWYFSENILRGLFVGLFVFPAKENFLGHIGLDRISGIYKVLKVLYDSAFSITKSKTPSTKDNLLWWRNSCENLHSASC